MEPRSRDRTPKSRRDRKRRKRIAPKKQPPSHTVAESYLSDATSDAPQPDMVDSEGEDCELQKYDLRFDARGESAMLRVGTTSEFVIPRAEGHRAALLLIRSYNPDRKLQATHLVVRSRHIKKALREVIGTYPGLNLNSLGDVTILAPPMCLFHYRAELEAYATESDSAVVRDHVNLCLGYMKGALKLEMALYETTMGTPGDPSIEYKHLWMAFKPGTLLYGKVDNYETALRGEPRPHGTAVFRLREINAVKNSDTGAIEHWELLSESVYFNGRNFGYCMVKSSIKYEGCKPLRTLTAFPLDLHSDQTLVRQSLLRRGRKYLSLCGPHSYRFYDGKIDLIDRLGPKVQHRIIVDHKSWASALGFSQSVFIPGTPLIDITAADHSNVSEEEVIMCSRQIGGFDLARREWALFDIGDIHDIQFNANAFDQLVFSREKKNWIRALVEQHDEDEEDFDDLIRGKGKGLIFLLHGPPGVGKTFTAESIADYTQRPLFQISSGELMGDASDVEKKLTGLLATAKKWNALVLIDEADVFMQERRIDDLQRNSLVSVLLRVIEYFEGIMFLTTNRAQTIDKAFHSRIHLSFAYPPLSAEALRTLWKSTIIRGCSGNRPKWLKRKFLNELATSRVNGRDIKNIVRMAHAMARSGKREMMAADIQQGLDALQSFETDFRRGLEQQRLEDAKDLPEA
ncbi:hypothetical protein AK830_g908 [Neonectria ditissima]|uniref:AAA+ ATPase domain-containing protein n=1 Tax=Neonectria ditissima TaxID=78410 RepID=A0A0P7BK02_9HYPO|nr:hypothetical protein AK830_g908 [Neonectria ditissima]